MQPSSMTGPPDSFTSTDTDEIAAGHPVPDSRRWIGGEWARHLSLAGSETSATDPGCLAGVLDAAARAVREVMVGAHRNVRHLLRLLHEPQDVPGGPGQRSNLSQPARDHALGLDALLRTPDLRDVRWPLRHVGRRLAYIEKLIGVYWIICTGQDALHWAEEDLGNLRVALNALLRLFRL